MKKSLLATVAAAALIAGPGLAIAQKQEAPANKTEAPARAPAAVQNAPAEKIAPAGKVAPVTKPETSGQAAPSGKAGDADIKARSGADTRSGTSVDTKPAPNAQTRSGTSADTKTGADAKTSAQPSGGAVALTADQKAKIRTSVLTANAPRVTNVSFSINVGTVVPRTVRVVSVPPTLVEIHPAWRGFLYFVHGDEIVIVEPGTLRIVAVLQV